METFTLPKRDAKGAQEYFDAKNAYTTGPMEVAMMIREKDGGFEAWKEYKLETAA